MNIFLSLSAICGFLTFKYITGIYVQPISIIHEFHICEFVYSLKCICNPQIHTCGTFMDICGQVQSSKHLSCLTGMFPPENKRGDAMLYCFNSHTVNKYLFVVCFAPDFSHFCVFFVSDLLFKMLSKLSAEVLESVLKSEMTMICLMEKICVLDNLCSGMS